MSSAREDVEEAISDLISAKEKIKELEQDLSGWRQHIQNVRAENASLHSQLEKLGEENEALKKGIERLKNSPINKPTSEIMREYKEMKLELQKTKDHVQFELDQKLQDIRKILGARHRSDDRPHETALQAAKRVMEELKEEKEARIIEKLKRRNTVKDATGRVYTPPAGYVLLKATEFEETLERALKNSLKSLFDS